MINITSNTINFTQKEKIKVPPRVECFMAVDINEGCFGSRIFDFIINTSKRNSGSSFCR